MYKTNIQLSSHMAGAEDNRMDKWNHDAINNESYDFSIISMHLNSIGLLLTTLLFIIICVAILKYSSKTCLRKCLYISCPCCVRTLNQESKDRNSRQGSTQVPEAKFYWNTPSEAQAIKIPLQETAISTLPTTLRDQPIPDSRRPAENLTNISPQPGEPRLQGSLKYKTFGQHLEEYTCFLIEN